NTMCFIRFPEEMFVYISNGELSIGHWKSLLELKNMDEMLTLVKKIRKDHLNVRKVEKIITELNSEKQKQKNREEKKDIFITETEDKLRDILGTNVTIRKNKRKAR